jgi:hypothetical protein
MEHSPFNLEDDDEEDDLSSLKPKNRIRPKLFENLKAETTRKKEGTEDVADYVKELESKADIELKKELALDRANEIEQEEISPEDQVVLDYLKAVEISGDYDEPLQESLEKIKQEEPNEEQDYEDLPELLLDHQHQEVSDQTIMVPIEHRPIPEPVPIYSPKQNEANIEQALSHKVSSENKQSKQADTMSLILTEAFFRSKSKEAPNIKSPKKTEETTGSIHLRADLHQKEDQLRATFRTVHTPIEVSPQQDLQQESDRSSFPQVEKNLKKEVPNIIPEIEQIGKTISEKTIAKSRLNEPEKIDIVHLKKADLLKVAKKIEIDGSSLATIYRSERLSEKGLRRIMEVYFRGGNIKKALKRELIEKQIDFERDPVLRDQGFNYQPIAVAPVSKIDELIQKKGIVWDNSDYHQTKKEKPSKKQAPKTVLKFTLVDLSFLILILILIVIIIFIVLIKR